MRQGESKLTLEKVRKLAEKTRARFEELKSRKKATDVEELLALERESRALADAAASLAKRIEGALDADPNDEEV